MSWDVFVQDLPVNARSIDDIPEDFVPKAVGSRAEIIAKIHEIVPSADFSDPAWGHVRGKAFSIEINLGNREEVYSFAFHVRGSDESAGIVSDILSHLGFRALDSGTGEVFDHARATNGWKRWRAYSDQILDQTDGQFNENTS